MNNQKIILKGITKPDNKKDTKETPILYISPDNLDMVMDALLVKKYRPLILSWAGPNYKKKLQDIIELYDSGELYNYKIALVKSKNTLYTEKDYDIKWETQCYSIGKNIINFGEHTLDGLKTYFDAKNLEQKIYSDSHLIE